ncbi:hypothetical protein [Salinilacihabitans rarus]|uniref:hypothetical protein n=1 Tax=Salinilacihabitans rarus TaxID=2961596 RepID=UPI0020C8525F|nr:hypothetical protein [Salinilacihabitans rarus]
MKDREACGRCSLSTAVDVAEADRDGSGDEGATRDPYGEARIEVDERELRLVSPGAWLSRLVERVDETGRRLTWGR